MSYYIIANDDFVKNLKTYFIRRYYHENVSISKDSTESRLA
jgi:hypothetical protein